MEDGIVHEEEDGSEGDEHEELEENSYSNGIQEEDGEDEEERERRSEDEGPSESEESEGSVEGESRPQSSPKTTQNSGDDNTHLDDIASTLKKTRESDLLKGQAVKRQIVRVLPDFLFFHH